MIPVRRLRRFHAVATLVWACLVIPTVLWWRNSVFWVALISVYANVVSHAGAWQSSRAEDAASTEE